MTPMRSIRSRLLAFLLVSAAFTALVVGFLSYRQLLRENEALFDYQLRQTALTLRDQGAIPDSAWATDPSSEVPDTIVQIWDIEGAVIYVSRPGIILPNQATLGFSDLLIGGQHWRVFSVATRGRIIQVAQPLSVRRDLAAAAALRSLAPLLAFVPLMAVLIWWLVGSSLSPLYRLAAEVKERDADTLAPVSEDGLPSEIAPVASALNALLTRLSRSFERERAFVADAAHELRSPLTALKLQLQLYGRASSEAEREQAITALNAGVERATRLVEQLLTLARSDPDAGLSPNFQYAAEVNLAELARRAAADTFPLAQARSIRIELEAPERVPIRGDASAIRILVRNLLDNAVRYTPQGGKVEVGIAETTEAARLVVDDSGPGIPPAERERVFDRFYRRSTGNGVGDGIGKDFGNETGTGLGLAIVKSIASQHHANISLGDSPLGGLQVSVDFPRESAEH